jgi:HAD superfamily hydrolase (TIGR01509 family)
MLIGTAYQRRCAAPIHAASQRHRTIGASWHHSSIRLSRDAMTATATTLRAVLLDIDGTMLDSNDAHAQSWVDVFQRNGFELPFERVRPLIGKGGDKLLPELTGLEHDSPEGKRLSEERKKLFTESYLPKLAPTRGARLLVETLQRAGLRVVIATSSSGDELYALLRQAGIDDLIEKATSADDGDSKPDPDIIQAALAKARVKPAEAVMVGDTPYDIEAAARCGVPTIALRCGGWWPDTALSGAAGLFDDPQALVEDLDASVIGQRMKR